MEYNLKAHHYLQCHVYTMQHTRICMHIRTYEDHHICHTCYGMLHIIFGKGSPLANVVPVLNIIGSPVFQQDSSRPLHSHEKESIHLLFVVFLVPSESDQVENPES